MHVCRGKNGNIDQNFVNLKLKMWIRWRMQTVEKERQRKGVKYRTDLQSLSTARKKIYMEIITMQTDYSNGIQ